MKKYYLELKASWDELTKKQKDSVRLIIAIFLISLFLIPL